MFRRHRHLIRPLVNHLVWGLSGAAPPTATRSLAEWIADHPDEGKVQRLADAGRVVFPPLQSVFGEPVTATATEIAVNSRWIATIDSGRTIGKHGAVITCDNQLISDVSGFIGNAQRTHPLLLAGRLPPATHIDGRVAVIASLGSYTYYHWLLDAVPRFGLLEQARQAVDYCYVPRSGRFHDEAVELLGIDRERLIAASRFSHVRARQLIVPSIPSSRQFVPPAAIEFLRERLLTHGRTQSPPRRFYITRRNARWRRVLNELQVVELLARHGYEVVELSGMSLREQIGLFAHAEAIIAPHGAGLANCVFCSPNTKVLEIAAPLRPSRCFFHLCHQLDLDYQIFMAGGVYPNRSREDSQLHINAEQLRSAMAIAEMN